MLDPAADVLIDLMALLCLHGHALKVQQEMPGMCCFTGKSNLPPLTEPTSNPHC